MRGAEEVRRLEARLDAIMAALKPAEFGGRAVYAVKMTVPEFIEGPDGKLVNNIEAADAEYRSLVELAQARGLIGS